MTAEEKTNKRKLSLGDVLGQDFELPEGLERLKGWLIYNFTVEGVPQVLEPIESAPKDVVRWATAVTHMEKTLKEQGHAGARLWTETDGSAIFNNVVKGGHNDKAQLDVSGSNPGGRYWEGIEFKLGPDGAVVRYLDVARHRDWKHRSDFARVRGVQDAPELAGMLITPKI